MLAIAGIRREVSVCGNYDESEVCNEVVETVID